MKRGRKTWYEGVLSIPMGRCGNFDIVHDVVPAGEPLFTANQRTRILGAHDIETIKFDHDTKWHRLLEKGGTWMTDLPIEQAQHDRELAGMSGHVLVGGLGLGYAATALCRNPKVHHVTVVEKSHEVVALVADATRRNLHHETRRKLTIVNDGLFRFLRCEGQRVRTADYTRAFYDIRTADSEDTFFFTVQKLRKLSVGVVAHDPVNWNEDVMRGQLRMNLLARLALMGDADAKAALPSEITDPGALAKRAIGRGGVFHNWMIPFWKWYSKTKPDMLTARKVAVWYAAKWGRWSWPGRGWVRAALEEVSRES